MPDAILTVPEAAKLLKVCDKTVYTWTHRADLAEHSEYDTMEDAVAYLAQQYTGEKIPVIVDDIPAV